MQKSEDRKRNISVQIFLLIQIFVDFTFFFFQLFPRSSSALFHSRSFTSFINEGKVYFRV